MRGPDPMTYAGAKQLHIEWAAFQKSLENHAHAELERSVRGAHETHLQLGDGR